MRDLRFRAWDKDLKIMHHWGFIGGGFVGISSVSGGITQPQMQYTGLHDRNGKEIWEGDIVVSTQITIGTAKPREIIWDADSASFRTETQMLANSQNRFEVIGNVWETPELLKGVDE